MESKLISVKKETVINNLSFPTSLCFGDRNELYVAESGLPWDGAPKGGRIYKIANGQSEMILEDLRFPVNGLCFHKGDLIISEGGYPGRISRYNSRGIRKTILDNLPGMGNYHTNMAVVGPDDLLYFSQGALTNMGVIGLDAYELGWLGRLPHNADIPGYDIQLRGENFETANPLVNGSDGKAITGAFSAFNTSSKKNQRIRGAVPCTASVMRCRLDGSGLELVCWGIRNAYGLGFLPDGRLIATDQGSDDRGSRPVGQVPDVLFEIKKGKWYGWPDFIAGNPVIDDRYLPSRGQAPQFILQNHSELPELETPLMEFPVNAAATKFTVIPETNEKYPGQLIVTLFGDEKPMTAPAGYKVGRNICRVDPKDWKMYPLPYLNLKRPIDVEYNPVDDSLYIVDFGDFEMTEKGMDSKSKSGAVVKVKLCSL